MNAVNAQIGDWLGLHSPATDTEILRIVEGQLAPAVIKRLIALGLERGELTPSSFHSAHSSTAGHTGEN